MLAPNRRPLFVAIPDALALATLLVALATVGGCSYAQMHGYAVVRTDADVRYEEGPFALLPVVASDPAHPAPLEAGVRRGILARAPEFVPTSTAETSSFVVRLEVERAAVEAGRTHIQARIEIASPDGAVTSSLATDHTVEGTDPAAVERIGEAFGARLAHYLRERERYHHW